ncbi:hypothetical protein IV417_00810 [Alphaproteobacteria bacterium KMM 3653]|uniref:Uncharacterized protein n=1 Tax=Harenicola maris TaxID=2841044 RepID=A0AAP2CP64_9RHOB|nr:hypothetical protein [Harenicola maris]
MSNTFSIGISGKGVHHGMFITEASRRWKSATLYDDGAAATAFRKAEVDLGAKGYLDKAGTDHAKRIAKNLAAPRKRDVTVVFKTTGGKPSVEVTGAGFRRFEMKLDDKTSIEKIKQEVGKILDAVEAVRLGAAAKGIMA